MPPSDRDVWRTSSPIALGPASGQSAVLGRNAELSGDCYQARLFYLAKKARSSRCQGFAAGSCIIARVGLNYGYGELQTPRQTVAVQVLRSTRFVEEMRMDGQARTISAQELYARLGTAAAAPAVVDVRERDDFDADDRLIVSALRCGIDANLGWLLPAGQSVVVYCAHGAEVGRNIAAELQQTGRDATYLDGGMAAWRAQNLPTRKKVSVPINRWVTRERPKIDRIACPWLIRRFIDPQAQFFYVSPAKVVAFAKEIDGTPYDIEGVEFAHEGERCAFDTLLRVFGIQDGALDQLATIVRGADTSRHDLGPQCGGLFAISVGLSANFADDHEMLVHGLVMYDALYRWCRSLQHETHNWPAKTATAA
jgi:rhodanese-related sulfurtransferase